MAFNAPGLIPARFLILLSHLTILILIFLSREQNVEACLAINWTKKDYELKDYQLTSGLIASIILTVIELIGHLCGVSMFATSALISVIVHSLGAITLSYFAAFEWDCNLYWWIFVFCSVFPGILEIINGIKVIVLHKF